MKRVIVLLLIAIITCACVFAADEPVIEYKDIDFSFVPTSAKYDAMGQSGIAYPGKSDTFFLNPSAMPYKGFGLSVPSFSFTVYNLEAIVSNEDTMQNINALIDGTSDDSTAISLAKTLLDNLGTGKNMLAKFDAGVGIKLGGIGLGTNVQVKIHSLNNGSSAASVLLIPEINLAETLAIGVKVIDTDMLSVSAGVAGHFVYKGYFDGVGLGTVTSILTNAEDIANTLMWQTPIMAGYAMPFDAGVTVGLLNDQLTISAVANNINGKYAMKSFSGAGSMVNSLAEGTLDVPAGVTINDSVDFEVETPWKLNFGVAFAPKLPLIQPVITADLVDMLEMVQNFDSETFRASDLLLHLNAGAEVQLLNMVAVRAGVNRGFASVGAAFTIPGVQVNASYGWQEFGEEIGDKSVDSFTISFNIGYDK